MPLSFDILHQLKTMPDVLREAAAKIPPQNYSKSPANGGFSLLEQACHLRDLEREGYLVCIHRILHEERPYLEDFDGAKVAAERNYRAQDLTAALQDFEQARSKALSLLESASDSQLERRGQFGETRTITLRDLAGMMLEHDASHRREIADLLEEISPPPSITCRT